jgi:hypothetical protein
METVYLLYIEDSSGDEYLEGVYRTRKAAEMALEFLKEWDGKNVKNDTIYEELVRDARDV